MQHSELAASATAKRSDFARARTFAAVLLVYVLLYASWHLLHWLPDGDETKYSDLVFLPVDALAVFAAWQASVRCREDPRLHGFWQRLTMAMAAVLAADTVQATYDFSTSTPPSPSVADVLYLAFYPLVIAAILKLPVPRDMARRRVRTVLDIAITATGISALVWYFILGPQAQHTDGSALDTLVAVAYPFGDLFVLVCVIAAYFRRAPPAVRPSLRLLGGGLALFFVADTVYSYGSLRDTYGNTNAVDVVTLMAVSLFAVAAAAQGRARSGDLSTAAPPPAALAARPNLIPYVSMAVGFGLLLAVAWSEPFFPDLSMALLAILLAAYVSARQYVSQRETAQLQRRLVTIVDSVGEGILTFTETGQILSANRAAEAAFRAEPGGLDGLTMESLLQNVDWEQRGEALSEGTRGRAGSDSLLGVRQTLHGRRRDGSVFSLEFLLSEAHIDGERVLIGVGQDVTERLRTEAALRNSERRFRAVFDNAGVGITVVDTTIGDDAAAATDFNSTYSEMVGYTVEELQGDFTRLSHPDDRLEDDAELANWLWRGTTSSYTRDVPLVRKDGSVLWGTVTLSTVRNAEGVAEFVISVLEDITERREMEQLKDEFISVVGHELRTPLTSIRGSLGLLESGVMGELSEEAMGMLSRAVTNTDRLVRLINDMLDIERMDAGRAEMDLRPVRAEELVQQSLQAVQAACDAAGVAVSVDVDPDLIVSADADRVVQSLVNLVGNAVKFSDRGGVVEITGRQDQEQGRFAVHDHGRGIPVGELEAIFERFHQVDGSDARDKGGTGLGLPIARSIVEHHGGRMWAESAPGEGSTFCFTLPLASPGVALLVCGSGGGAERVGTLVADLGCTPLRAADLDAALAAIVEQAPAAVVLPAGAQIARWADGLAAACRTHGIPVVAVGQETPPQELLDGLSAWVHESDGRDGLLAALQLVVPALRHGTILIVEDDPTLGAILTRVLEQGGSPTRLARTAVEAVDAIRQAPPSLVILDLVLPGDDGFTVVDRLRGEGLLNGVPLLVYTAMNLDSGDRERLQLGHTEFLFKTETTPQDVGAHAAQLLWRIADPVEG